MSMTVYAVPGRRPMQCSGEEIMNKSKPAAKSSKGSKAKAKNLKVKTNLKAGLYWIVNSPAA